MFRYVGHGLLQKFRRNHGPTWLVAVVVYGGWVLLTCRHADIPLPLLVVLGGIVIAWQGSLQHETIHGHPGNRVLAYLLGAPPLSLWLPYGVYRDTHRRHHATPHLTEPAHDPESHRHASSLERTALGRLTVGPVLAIGRFFVETLRSRQNGAAWLVHAVTVALVLGWLHHVGLPLWKYLVAFVYPGTSLTLLRSLAEHREDAEHGRRTCVIEAGWFFRLLYLNNNLHVMHHRFPHVPWFELPARWRLERADFVAKHPDLVHDGYDAVVFR